MVEMQHSVRKKRDDGKKDWRWREGEMSREIYTGERKGTMSRVSSTTGRRSARRFERLSVDICVLCVGVVRLRVSVYKASRVCCWGSRMSNYKNKKDANADEKLWESERAKKWDCTWVPCASVEHEYGVAVPRFERMVFGQVQGDAAAAAASKVSSMCFVFLYSWSLKSISIAPAVVGPFITQTCAHTHTWIMWVLYFSPRPVSLGVAGTIFSSYMPASRQSFIHWGKLREQVYN